MPLRFLQIGKIAALDSFILCVVHFHGLIILISSHCFRWVGCSRLVELQLAHAERNEVSAAYNHALYLQQRTAMMQTWADYLDKLKAGAQVVPLRA